MEDDLEMGWGGRYPMRISKLPGNLALTNVEKFYRVETRLKHPLGEAGEG